MALIIARARFNGWRIGDLVEVDDELAAVYVENGLADPVVDRRSEPRRRRSAGTRGDAPTAT